MHDVGGADGHPYCILGTQPKMLAQVQAVARLLLQAIPPQQTAGTVKK